VVAVLLQFLCLLRFVLVVVGRVKKQKNGEEEENLIIMGKKNHRAERDLHYARIADSFKNLSQVQAALRREGLESSSLIIGIDYTKSNLYKGKQTFGGRSLHDISPHRQNPYQQVIEMISKTLEPFDDDGRIPTFGFGDITTKGTGVFPFLKNREPNGVEQVLARYNEITPSVKLLGPTNFAPIIRQAISIVKYHRSFHILLIICDGEVINRRETVQAIVDASQYALSIVVVGVGDGPWDTMEEFDDGLPERQFDNFQFVDFSKVMAQRANSHSNDSALARFAVNALMEVPFQFRDIRRLNLL